MSFTGISIIVLIFVTGSLSLIIMHKFENEYFPFYQFEHLATRGEIKHFVSSGVKSIGFAEDTDSMVIRQNRLDLAEAVGFDGRCLVTGHQVHSDCVTIVTEKEEGRGALDRTSRLPDTDALVTDREGICLMVLSADCVPVLLFDPVRRVVAAVHAGWRGTVAQIVVRTVKVMQERFGCCPEHLLAGIGPSIGKCCFEVGDEVAAAFRELYLTSGKIVFAGKASGKYQVDLWEANRQELLMAGLKPENIEVAGLCTACCTDHFFSYRKEGKRAGRFGAGIMLCGTEIQH